MSKPTPRLFLYLYEDDRRVGEIGFNRHYTADEIINCVNMHEELVEGLKKALKHFSNKERGWTMRDQSICEELMAVLAESEGGAK